MARLELCVRCKGWSFARRSAQALAGARRAMLDWLTSFGDSVKDDQVMQPGSGWPSQTAGLGRNPRYDLRGASPVELFRSSIGSLPVADRLPQGVRGTLIRFTPTHDCLTAVACADALSRLLWAGVDVGPALPENRERFLRDVRLSIQG